MGSVHYSFNRDGWIKWKLGDTCVRRKVHKVTFNFTK